MNHPAPEVHEAREQAQNSWVPWALMDTPSELFTVDDLATTEGDWTDDADEPSFAAFGTLTDGRWWAAEGWCDYTGWGCQSGADYYVSDTREDVVANGLTNDARSALGLELA